MHIEVRAEGEIVESQELLNGTRTVAFEATSVDGVWLVSAVVSWNRGLIDYAGEGDLTLSRDGAELYATLVGAHFDEDSEEGSDVALALSYEIDGGAGEYEAAIGRAEGRIRIAGDLVDGTWRLRLEST